MILYKYVSIETAGRILGHNSIGFSQPKYFNDPFDQPWYPDEPGTDTNDVTKLLGSLRTTAKERGWSESAGILSLTRTPTNALMWAHYADNHRGVVLGFDMEKAGLTDENCNLIPAQYGSVFYVTQRNVEPFISRPIKGIAVGETYNFPHDHFEKLQRLFLYKPMCWAYEEEVRVVKCLNGLLPETLENKSGNFDIVEIADRQLHAFKLWLYLRVIFWLPNSE